MILFQPVMGARDGRNTLDPLLNRLTMEYIDETDLARRLNSLFKVSLKLTCTMDAAVHV